MKAVLISIRPKWVKKIIDGEKTIEVRKTRPTTETPFKCYIYCTGVKQMNLDDYVSLHAATGGKIDEWSTKVIGEFVCDKVLTIDCDSVSLFDKDTGERLTDSTCLTRDDLWDYTHGYCAFGWHISDLKIYDKPKELSEFGVKRSPQSWRYVEVEG